MIIAGIKTYSGVLPASGLTDLHPPELSDNIYDFLDIFFRKVTVGIFHKDSVTFIWEMLVLLRKPIGISATQRPHVHIVLSDRNWIIEELAQQLVDTLPYVTADTIADPTAALQYYMTYIARTKRVSPVELALFTHREEEPSAGRRFDEAAKAVDYAVSMSNATDRLVEALGVVKRKCICPGIDLDRFRPRLKIAVVGRTYHTGRKGEALVRAVMDVADIDWHFTGDGWPAPGLHIAPEALPEFYRSMDYVLVPATNEGGPMSVLEALASGVPVIASDVGWAAEFPHIHFERGNAASLRGVLQQLRAERFALRDHVTDLTWQSWVQSHDELFATLAPKETRSLPMSLPHTNIRSVALLTHGAEDTALGGPSVRVPRTRDELVKLGVRATANNRINATVAAADVVHGFNIWAPSDAYRMARQVERLHRPFVFSPILLDLSEAPFWQVDLLQAFRCAQNAQNAEALVDNAFALHEQQQRQPKDFVPGYTAALSAINKISFATIFLSVQERELFERLVGAPATNPFLVRNPVDLERFNAADPDLFRTTYGLDDYVLCVGRIEVRKNQLMLAAALAATGLPLVLIGHEADAEYAALIRSFGGPNLHMIGRIDPTSPLLTSAIAGARVFSLPSWAEGAPLAALEAAAAGVPMVLSDRSAEIEYFGCHAAYCNPASMTSIREEIIRAWETAGDESAREALRQLVREQYNWSTHAKATLAVYEAAVAPATDATLPMTPPPLATPPAATGIVFDITTWANNLEKYSGIVRVECAIARALLSRTDVAVRFILYLDSSEFVEIPRAIVQLGSIGSYVKLVRNSVSRPSLPRNFIGFSDMITVGSGWTQSATYTASIVSLSRRFGLRLNVLLHDLTPYLFPHWFEEGYADKWTTNCRTIVSNADRILINSDSTGRDVGRFCMAQEIDTPTLGRIRLADEIGDFSKGVITPAAQAVCEKLSAVPFVLAIGEIDVRNNYSLLYDVWVMLCERMGDSAPHLVIVGGVSWDGQAAARALREDSRVNKHVQILEDVDDILLARLYEQSLFTVHPSLYEGWSLPIGESLSQGKICLASATSSTPEIAPAVTDLLPPMDRSAWAARIEHYARSASSRASREAEVRAGFVMTSWAQTTDNIVHVLNAQTRSPVPDQYLAGTIAAVNDRFASRFLEDGWYPAEPWGVWSGNRRATFAFHLVGRPAGDMVLTLLARILKQPGDRCIYNAAVNDLACGSIAFGPDLGNHETDYSIGRVIVPSRALENDDLVRIVLETDIIHRACDLHPGSPDVRRLGLGLSAFIFEAKRHAGDATRLLSTQPDIRAMLGIPVTLDMARMLADNPSRRSITPDQWIAALAAFVQSGEVLPEGVASVDGLLVFVTGTARLRLGEEAIIDLLIEVDFSAAKSTIIDAFANNDLITSYSIDPGVTLISARVPSARLGASDPLTLALCTRSKRNAPEFVIKMLRIRTANSTVVLPLLPNRTVSLADQFPKVPYKAKGAVETVIPFSTPRGDIDAVLVLEGLSHRVRTVEVDGEPPEIVPAPSGHILVTLRGGTEQRRHGKIVISADLIDPYANDTDGWRVTFSPLAPLDAPAVSNALRRITFGAWHDAGEDSIQWGAGETVSFWVRPGTSAGVRVVAEVIGRLEAASNLIITVDGVATHADVEPESDTGRFALLIPFSDSTKMFRSVTISGLPTARPVDLGINEDSRLLSLLLLEVSATPASIG